MKKLIFRNLVKDIAVFFILASISLTLIAWVMQAVNYLDIVSEDGHGFKVYFMFTILSLPKLYGKLIIFLFFISVFYIISKYQNNNEILIFWSHGVKKRQFINVVLFFSIFILIIQILLNVFIAPRTQDLARDYLRSSNIDYLPSLIGQKKFIDTVKNLTIFIENKNDNGYLENIFIKDASNSENPKIISAEKGIIIKRNGNYSIKLLNGTIGNINKKKSNILKFSETNLDLSDYGTKSITNAKISEHDSFQLIGCLIEYHKMRLKNFELAYVTESKYSESLFVCNVDSINAIFKEVYRRAVLPFYIFFITLIASTLALIDRNNISYNKFKISLFIVGIVFVILSEISNSYAFYFSSYNNFLLAMPILSLIFLYILIFLNLKQKSGSNDQYV
mgnify:FL=1